MTIQVSQALEILGAKRVIWIDDRFNTTPVQLATVLTNSLEIALACEFAELHDAFSAYEIDPAGALQAVTQILTDLRPERFEEIKTAFFVQEGEQKAFPTNELSIDVIASACKLLNVADVDRWTFEKADQDLPALCAAGDGELSYIVDLNEAGGSKTRGLEMLQILWEGNSKGTAFILTHETDIAGEGKKEIDLRTDMAKDGGLGVPICVIAKERLSGAEGDGIEEALKIGLKRAGLRRSLHQVLDRARGKLQAAIDSASWSLLSVPPETLESHVFERGYKEGVSELHVVERAISAHLGKEAREFFGVDDLVLESAQRLRALRSIPLKGDSSVIDPHLAAFREAEVWESDELLNRALTPIACGDVFELDKDEQGTKASKQKFVLLGQPCDISIRPEQGKRAQDSAFLVPLKTKTKSGEKAEQKEKEPLLPFSLGGEQWACDFRNTSVARLSILDLASFRADGRVRVDEDHAAPSGMLVGQQKVYDERTKFVAAALDDPSLRPPAGAFSFAFQLTFASSGAFKHIHSPTFEDVSSEKVNKKTITRPKRATWRLRRCGRIRMPYAAALLDQYTSVMTRHAFDLDFMSPGIESGASKDEATIAAVAEREVPLPNLDGAGEGSFEISTPATSEVVAGAPISGSGDINRFADPDADQTTPSQG